MFTDFNSEALTPPRNSFTPSSARDASTPYILMDEYGQTPDHFYLATNTPKAVARINQVKRRLDMDFCDGSDENESIRPKKKRSSSSHFPAYKTKALETARFDTSLGHITKKFLEILANSPNGVLNLNRACNMLSVPKRRIYDITNVLEGAGLLQKTSRNNIQWKGQSGEYEDPVKYELETDIYCLESKENQLDALIDSTKAAIKLLKNEDKQYAFVMYDDIRSITEFKGQTLIGIKAAPDTLLEAHENYKIRLKSQGNEICAYLVSEEPVLRGVENKLNKNTDVDESDELIILNSGDPALKYALIEEEDDLAPMGKNFLLQTEDQHSDSLPFLHLEPQLLEEDYTFTLDEAEGISDLFDTCEFSCS